jgi:septum formation protein
LAFQKAEEVSKRNPNKYVIGADTVVVAGNIVLGKPRNAQEVLWMMQRLSGHRHHVYTGTAFLGPGSKKIGIKLEMSRIGFHRLKKEEVEIYAQSMEPYDKAGAYDIKGKARKWIDDLAGDYFNVLGLPVDWLIPELNRLGLIRFR